MSKFKVHGFIPVQNGLQTVLTKVIEADRFNVYAKNQIAFYVDHEEEGWFKGLRSEIICEIKLEADFIVEKIGG